MVSCLRHVGGDSSVALLFPVHYWLLLLWRFLFSLVFARFLFWSQPFVLAGVLIPFVLLLCSSLWYLFLLFSLLLILNFFLPPSLWWGCVFTRLY